MKSLSSLLLSLCLLLAVGLFPNGSWALTGAGTGAEKETTEEEALKLMGDAQKLKDILPEMSTDDALTIAQLLEDIRNDPDSQQLIEDLKSSKVAQEPQMQEMLEGMSKKEVVVTINQVLDELRAVEVLFQDPAKAVEELHKEGLIEAAHLSEYQENPELLERDIRNGLHFSFVTFSMAAELL